MKLIIDIETDGLLIDVNTIHCLVIRDADTNQVFSYTNKKRLIGSVGDIPEGIQYLKDNATLIIGHNIIGYDIAVIKKLYGVSFDVPLFDTLIASKLRYSNMPMLDANSTKLPSKLKGSHSLKSWGYRMGEFKGEFNEWESLTQEMLDYCIQDTLVTQKLYSKKLFDTYPKAMLIEMQFKAIITRQEMYGWFFDIPAAQKLHVELLTEAERIKTEVFRTFTPLPTWMPMKEVAQYNKDGGVSKVYQTQVNKGAIMDAKRGWGRYESLTFNPSSRDHIARWLQEVYGWKPEEYTEKGSIIINEKVLNKLEFDEGKLLASYFTVAKLVGQLAEGDNAWLKKVGKDGRMHGSIDTLGAVTRRCTHSKPNVAQVPSNRAYKGHESRSLFGVSKGKKLVGCDADGLELRTLSHYMALYDNGVYASAVDQGKKEDGTDIHTLNQRAAGLPTRDDAKTFIYAFLYGAGDEKIGSIVGGDAKKGKALKRKFFKQVPAIKELIKQVKAKAEAQGYLLALDGAKYYIRSPHSALNTLLQGAGALVMKYYLIQLDKNLEKVYTNSKNKEVQYEFVGNIHDEVQIECDEDIAEDVAKIAEKTFEDITAQLKFRIPLRGSANIGNNWAETH